MDATLTFTAVVDDGRAMTDLREAIAMHGARPIVRDIRLRAAWWAIKSVLGFGHIGDPGAIFTAAFLIDPGIFVHDAFPAASALMGAIGGWIAARNGRKARLKIGDVEIEARTPEEVQQMLKIVEAYQKQNTKPVVIKPPGSSQ